MEYYVQQKEMKARMRIWPGAFQLSLCYKSYYPSRAIRFPQNSIMFKALAQAA